MRIFVFKHFHKFTNKQGISDTDLINAVRRAEQGLIDADLGGGVIKQRIARKGQGTRSGFRSIILFRHKDKAFFAHGFAKNEQSNISAQELIFFKSLASDTFALSEEKLNFLLNEQELRELKNE